MRKGTFRCACCRRILLRDPRVKNQQYCGTKRCQRARKSKWQREKQKADADYRANKRESQRAWKTKNPDYWQQYRKNNQQYCLRNRQMQKARDRVKQQTVTAREHLAKVDTLERIINDTSMTYIISGVSGNLAKMDALKVKIIPITPT